MLLFTSILLSVVICTAVLGILFWVKNPYYRINREKTIQLLEWMLLGQATEADWQFFCGYPVRHDPLLEQVRQKCQDIDEAHFIGDNRDGILLSPKGLKDLRVVLDQLKQDVSNDKV